MPILTTARLLQPNGVVEFIEIDPRPRAFMVGRRHSEAPDHNSSPETNWTDKISDRFTNPCDAHLATTVPGWTERVKERHKAALRPQDGVPAEKLRSWLEGGGFWDVKETVIPLPVGGPSPAGKLLLRIMMEELSIENSIPLLKENMSAINLNEISLGNYYVNLHVLTARKPELPRDGDMLMDGTRQEMRSMKDDTTVRRSDARTNRWRRFELDARLTTMMETLTTLKVRPSCSSSPMIRSRIEWPVISRSRTC